MFQQFFSIFQTDAFLLTLKVLVTSSSLWLPFLLGFIFWQVWTRYTFFWAEQRQDYSLLEISIPHEILKTPLAMELALAAIHFTSGETTAFERYWNGKRRPWMSLEIVSTEGQIHFYVWVRSFFRNFVEAAFYGQFPDIEIHEVPDYSLAIDVKPDKYIVWGCEFKLTKADPLPIKTYVDYGLDKPDTKDEQRVDPLTPLLEWLGQCNQKGHIWIQILIQAHKKDLHKKGGWFYERTTWKDEIDALVHKLMHRDPKTLGPADNQKKTDAQGYLVLPSLTELERNTVEAVQRSLHKPAFNVGIRSVYLSERETFTPKHIVGILGSMRQFNSFEMNGFAPTRWFAIFDWPWQFEGLRGPRVARKLVKVFRMRSFFHPPYLQKSFILTTEELATLYHFPSGITAPVPAMTRMMSRKAEPPSNLPI